MSKTVAIPTLDISQETQRHVIVAQGDEHVYHAHPTTVLMPDGRTIFAVWTYGHAGPLGPMKKSSDGGLTWSDLLPLPGDWRAIRNCPAIYRLVDANGKARLFVFAGSDGSGDMIMHQAYSEDDGATWTTMRKNGIRAGMPWTTIVSVGNGVYLAQTNARRENDPDPTSNNIIQSWSYDGGLTWTPAQIVLDMPGYKPSEPAIIRSPDGKQLISIMRENSRKLNSLLMASNDEGKTWSAPRELPASLTGDRHVARYSPDGRLVIVFRDRAALSPTNSHFVAWVGTYDDLIAGRDGQYRIKLLHSFAGWDNGYSGLEVLPDGTFVATTYIKYRPGKEQQSIVSVRFKLTEIDAMAAAAGYISADHEKASSGDTHLPTDTGAGVERLATAADAPVADARVANVPVKGGLTSLDSSLQNVALHKPVKESSVFKTWFGRKAVDGDWEQTASRWITQRGAELPHWLEIDLMGAYVLEKAEVWTGLVVEPVKQFYFQYWDGKAWVDIPGAAVTDNQAQQVSLSFSAPVVADKVRFVAPENGSLDQIRVREILIYGRPIQH